MWEAIRRIACFRMRLINCSIHVVEKLNLRQTQNIGGSQQLRLTNSSESQRRSAAGGPMPSVLSARSRQKKSLNAFSCIARQRSAES